MLAGTKSPVDPSEAELIQRVLVGQDEAFRELVRPYELAYSGYEGVLKNGADDAAQEAVLEAFINLHRFRGDSKFSTWLIQITANEALVKLRKERRQKLHDSLDQQPTDEAGDYIPRDFPDWREIPSEALQRKELRRALSVALASMRPKFWEGLLETCNSSPSHKPPRCAVLGKVPVKKATLAGPPSDASCACTGNRWELQNRGQ